MSLDVQIVFLPSFTASQLGTLGNDADHPHSISTPSLVFYDYHLGVASTQGSQAGTLPVAAPTNGEVVLEIRSSDGDPSVVFAPIGFIAEWWKPQGGTKTLVTPDLMADDENSPLQGVALHAERQIPGGFSYHGAPTAWTDWNHHAGAIVSRPGSGRPESPLHIPHVALFTSDNPGDLTYGVELAVVVGSQIHGYYRFSGAVIRIGAGS